MEVIDVAVNPQYCGLKDGYNFIVSNILRGGIL